MAATTETDHEEHEHTDGSGAAPPAGRRRGRGPIAVAVGFLGELLITAGLVLGLFVVYSLWWTNVIADRAADQQADKVRDTWNHEDTGPGVLDTRAGIGFLHVPSMSKDEILVEKGTSMKILNDGVAGYYTDPVKATLPMSGKKGNFSLAAHRDGHGAKFHGIDKIEKGDPIVFETRDKWYVYKVYGILPETSKYNIDVLDPVPEESGRKKAGHYITLTTCTPVYTSRYRYIVWGELDRVEKVDAERTPPEELR
ncbi:class E sortase [Streptomyces leeuwenhoekii]|uniref:Membrane protein n=1 Tax=Streptomyces leeuwenhoekii TaxID=1437453 RepID=A0A0F7VRA6_STRLW|nr:class E sortase [Streptomyces leeuwenhoekii]KMS81230.1 membrane protein [Streptomyces leeuwenhoekii]CQR63034.1 Sortase Family Protein [Streptomyces leeuwenhoekii]